MSEQAKRYYAYNLYETTLEQDGSRLERLLSGGEVYFTSDYDRDIKALEDEKTEIAKQGIARRKEAESAEAKNAALDAALTEVCEERDKYHEDYTRLREALEDIAVIGDPVSSERAYAALKRSE